MIETIVGETRINVLYAKAISKCYFLLLAKKVNFTLFSLNFTIFFYPFLLHTQAIIRRRRNKISGLNVENVWCMNASILKGKASEFFMHLFKSNDPCNPHTVYNYIYSIYWHCRTSFSCLSQWKRLKMIFSLCTLAKS